MKNLLRIQEVLRRTGLSQSALYRSMNGEEGPTIERFPRPVRIGSKAVAWIESEVEMWIDGRVDERDARQGARK
jgi:prophage regulatory protein